MAEASMTSKEASPWNSGERLQQLSALLFLIFETVKLHPTSVTAASTAASNRQLRLAVCNWQKLLSSHWFRSQFSLFSEQLGASLPRLLPPPHPTAPGKPRNVLGANVNFLRCRQGKMDKLDFKSETCFLCIRTESSGAT